MLPSTICNHHLFLPPYICSDKFENSIAPHLRQAENNGTVLRWAAASALAEILKLKTAQYTELMPKIETLCAHEADNGVKKKYLDAIKKVKKYALLAIVNYPKIKKPSS